MKEHPDAIQIDRGITSFCGADKVGRKTALELFKTRLPLVVIEQDSNVIEALLRDIQVPYVEGAAAQAHLDKVTGGES